MKSEIENLKEQLKLADRNYLKLKNDFDERVEQAKREGYEEATKRAKEMAVFNIPYICKFDNTPTRLVGIVIPEDNEHKVVEPILTAPVKVEFKKRAGHPIDINLRRQQLDEYFHAYPIDSTVWVRHTHDWIKAKVMAHHRHNKGYSASIEVLTIENKTLHILWGNRDFIRTTLPSGESVNIGAYLDQDT